MRRFAHALLALVLVPVVMLATSNAAEAVARGSWKHGEVSMGTGSWNCNFDAQYVVTGPLAAEVAVRNAACVKGWANSLANLDPSESYVRFEFKGVDGSGAACRYGSGRIYGSSSTFLAGGSTEARNLGSATCEVQDVCLTVSASWNFMPDGYHTVCESFPMGALPDADGGGPGCEHGTMTAAKYEATTYQFNQDYNKIQAYWWWNNKDTQNDAWTAYGVRRSPEANGGKPYGYWSTSNGSRPAFPQTNNMDVGGQWLKTLGTTGGFVGIGMVHKSQLKTVTGGNALGGFPQTLQGGVLGLNNPNRCLFYFGEKVALTVDDAWDEPGGTVDGTVVPDSSTPPPATEPTAPANDCNFDILDPSTYASAGACALVSLMLELIETVGKVAEAIGLVIAALAELAAAIVGPIVEALAEIVAALVGLAADIASAILDGLQALFVPPSGTFNGWTSLRDQAETRAPFSMAFGLAEAVQGIGDGFEGAGSCGVIASYQIEGTTASADCANLSDTPNYGALYALASAAIVGTTALTMFSIARGMVSNQ